ncbi:MAG TPA: hypothetical protein H9894_04710 [Candidatus Desulfovibrio intestinipullorum]|uniref:Uncharacterized protein n=1 Tax=Candidatus Desulfovibrio intestinipullorum TaxID=2838536 RepID=A0A9D1TPV8_9BACT|nr:hypothetical protein [Candidatus Desulfovibrio intestinipullorum]
MLTGMITATVLGPFFTPFFLVVVSRLRTRKKRGQTA